MKKNIEELEDLPEKKSSGEFEIVEVPETMRRAFKTPEGEIIEGDQAIARILNLLEEIKRAVK